MSAVDPAPPFRVRGRHVLFGVVGFFAVVIAADAAFLTLAIRSFPGQVSQTPFEDGLAYNRQIARREAQAKLGFAAEAEAAPGAVVVRMRDRTGAALPGLVVTGELRRPATDAGKRPLTFVEAAPGLYRAPAAGAAGAWDLSFTAAGARGERFEAQRRLSWP